ncbi:uncharacterized protein BDR25DRAFT_250046 [Lindgomyces ingoldianus]|uniref:Uncharacterized protein n=1 Tax=Lindgomyces ingoldianus TaxID=673940 RepID=A0ACB6RGB3_9PLEO|nr:uncharacterized protein BDR25DRAFT_250046 [Lindgomyces ingoldianus]KAF2477803.1 hypothetical protein BDR25DRAFT_250046 [Lindgomyces ingoldianus]
MFNFSGGLLAGQHDAQKERAPPSRPTPVTFPCLTPPKPLSTKLPSAWTTPGIPAHFLTLKKPSDVSCDTLALLNISFRPQCDFETLLLSVSKDGEPYVPPKSWLDPPGLGELEASSASQLSPALLSNGRRVPDRKEFYMRVKELSFNNEDAFANLTRKANPGQAPLRLAHFRRFWEGLDNMAYYWDSSLDEYFPPSRENATTEVDTLQNQASGNDHDHEQMQKDRAEAECKDTSLEEPRKKAKTGAESNETITLPINSLGVTSTRPAPPSSISSSKALPARIAPPKLPWVVDSGSLTQKPIDLSRGTYRGYRIGNGAEMPDQYRLECVRSFLEPIAWAFGVTFIPHRRPPVLCLEHVRFPVRMNTVAWRGPADRTKARQGWMEGPVIGVQCRPDTNFGSNGNLEAESVLDAARELGGMLLLAQERAREGKTEKKAGEGKWWTTTPRWGGGPGGEVGEATGTSDALSQEATPKAEEKAPNRARFGSKDRRRPSPADTWKALKPGNPLWDPKIVYEAIGRDPSDECDEVFMVSSLNHHISVLKLRVHPQYISYLTYGILPEQAPSDPNWSSPLLQRTRWYDLFNVQERMEAMRGIWGIMAYLMRAQDQGKEDVVMNES